MTELEVLQAKLKELTGSDPTTIAKRRIIFKMIREIRERMNEEVAE